MRRPRRVKPSGKVLRAVRPNIGLEMAYRRRLLALVDAMHKSVAYWLTATYRANEPRIAQDETPAKALQKAIDKLVKQWRKGFDEGADSLADYFAEAAGDRSDAQLRKILKDAGLSVKFRMSPAMRDILDATTAENVGLIKSIPEQYLGQVQGLVMRSVTRGRDLKSLTDELQKRYQLTRHRAALIARDQNNKATSAMTRARQQELGLTKAIWVHSHAGKEPRPTHLKNDGKTYDVTTGWYDPAVKKHIWPGELINCRCVSRTIVKGFS